MAKQDINIGVEGNDGTGDSIRESFRKSNENFTELYAVFGVGGQITFTTLSDTPDTLTPNTIPLVNSAGTLVQLVTLASNSALGGGATDTITFAYDQAGKLVISSAFTKMSDDLSPTLGGPLDAGGFGIANVGISTIEAERLKLQQIQAMQSGGGAKNNTMLYVGLGILGLLVVGGVVYAVVKK